MLASPPARIIERFEWLCSKLGERQAMRLSRYLSFNVSSNLDPTWNALTALGISPFDLCSPPGIELLQFSVKNVILPFGDVLIHHDLELSSAELVNALRSLKSRTIKDLHSRIPSGRVSSADVSSLSSEASDRDRILSATRRTRVRYYLLIRCVALRCFSRFVCILLNFCF